MLRRSFNLKKIQITLLRDYNEEIIDGIYFAACDAERSAHSQASERAIEIKSDPDLSDEERGMLEVDLGDDTFEAGLIRNISEEMTIVALFKTVEITLKRMLERSGLFTDSEINCFFRVSELKRIVKAKLVDIEALPGFNDYDELRCINNCIKHQGKVGSELAAFSTWNEGDKLESLWSHYSRLKPGVRRFIYGVSEEILAKIT